MLPSLYVSSAIVQSVKRVKIFHQEAGDRESLAEVELGMHLCISLMVILMMIQMMMLGRSD